MAHSSGKNAVPIPRLARLRAANSVPVVVKEAPRYTDSSKEKAPRCVTSRGDGKRMHRDQDVRRALAPLKALAERIGVAVILLRHLNKAAGGSALYRGGGSLGIIGSARFGLVLAADPADPERRILASTKTNVGKPPASLALRLVAVEGTDVARLAWEGPSTHTAETLLTPRRPTISAARWRPPRMCYGRSSKMDRAPQKRSKPRRRRRAYPIGPSFARKAHSGSRPRRSASRRGGSGDCRATRARSGTRRLPRLPKIAKIAN